MIQRRLRIAKWLGTTPAVGFCTLCNREFKVPMSALGRTADAQATLQKQFDRHKCDYEDSIEAAAPIPTDILLRQVPDEDEEDEEEDDPKDEDDDEGADDGYSE